MKTKSILILIVALFLIGGMGCEKEKETKNIELKEFSFLGCKEKPTKESLSIATTEGVDNNEYIEYKAMKGGYLHLKHVNAQFNCCPDTIKASISADVNNIKIIETEIDPKCNCICDYDLEYKIGSLLTNEYTLIFCRDGHEYARFTIQYSPSIEGKFIIKK